MARPYAALPIVPKNLLVTKAVPCVAIRNPVPPKTFQPAKEAILPTVRQLTPNLRSSDPKRKRDNMINDACANTRPASE